MTLRDELLKAGLVSREKADRVETQTRKREHQLKKDKAAAAAEAARRAEEERRLEREREKKQERDRQLNQEREASRRRKEAEARVGQLIEAHRLNDAEAEIKYNVLIDRLYIRYVLVTQRQQRLLALGEIGVVRNPAKDQDLILVDRTTALKLAEIFPENVAVLHPKDGGVTVDEDTMRPD